MSDLLTVTNEKGRQFNVRVVQAGDRYGLNDCLTHDGEPLVEFYDATYAAEPGFGPRGQFVSRYRLSTLLERPNSGINLDGGVPVWQVNAANVADAIEFARERVGA